MTLSFVEKLCYRCGRSSPSGDAPHASASPVTMDAPALLPGRFVTRQPRASTIFDRTCKPASESVRRTVGGSIRIAAIRQGRHAADFVG